jgi:hypothetical protein
MADSALRIKLAEADGMMKNADKFCKKARRESPLHFTSSTRLSPFRASLLACSYAWCQDLFNWSPEYDRGGAEYEKAATIYKNYKQWDKAIYAYEKCAEANGKASLPTKVAMYIPRFSQ